MPIQGVKQISEYVMKRGRTLIITEFDGTQASYNKLPDGTIYVDTKSGKSYVKPRQVDDKGFPLVGAWWRPIAKFEDIDIPKVKDSNLKALFDGIYVESDDQGKNLFEMIAKAAKSGALNTLDRDTKYFAGDITYSSDLPTWARLECVTDGITASTSTEQKHVEAGSYYNDGTTVWIIDDVRDGHLPGEIIYSHTLRDGYLKLDGAVVVATSHSRLVNYIKKYGLSISEAEWNRNQSGFVLDENSNTLRLPNLMGRVTQGGNIPSTIEAGLPNITGTLYGGAIYGHELYENLKNHEEGALSVTDGGNKAPAIPDGSSDAIYGVKLDASKDNPVYGKSNTVQPPAITLIPQIKY